MVDAFGSGIYLDERLDFAVNTAGDLRTVSGIDELEKDLSIQMIAGLRQYLGQPPTSNLDAKIFNTASNIALADTRVASVNTDQSSVSFNQTRDEMILNLVVRTVDGEQELVFEV